MQDYPPRFFSSNTNKADAISCITASYVKFKLILSVCDNKQLLIHWLFINCIAIIVYINDK